METQTIVKGKYAGLTLPRDLGEEPDYQEKVNAAKAKVTTERTASALAREYVRIRKQKDAIAAALYDLQVELSAVSQLMTKQFEDEGVDNIRVDGRPVSTYLEPAAKVVDKAAFRDWCLADPDLAPKLQLWPSTMVDLVKQRLLAGEDVPPGVETSAVTRIRLGAQQ